MTVTQITRKSLKRAFAYVCTTDISKEKRNRKSKFSGQRLGLRVESHI